MIPSQREQFGMKRTEAIEIKSGIEERRSASPDTPFKMLQNDCSFRSAAKFEA